MGFRIGFWDLDFEIFPVIRPQPVLLGGLFIGVLSALPIISVGNCCCCAWIVAGGYLAAHVAQQEQADRLSPMQGLLTGFAAGIVGAFVWLIVALALDVVIAPLQQRLVDQMLRGAADMPPNARQWLEMVGARSNSVLRFVAGFMFHFVGSTFAALGGLAGAFMSTRDLPPALGGDSTVVPPPL